MKDHSWLLRECSVDKLVMATGMEMDCRGGGAMMGDGLTNFVWLDNVMDYWYAAVSEQAALQPPTRQCSTRRRTADPGPCLEQWLAPAARTTQIKAAGYQITR